MVSRPVRKGHIVARLAALRAEAPAGGVRTRPERGAVTLTHPDRIYWEDAGVTKQGLADYYAQVWPRMAPFVAARPLALLRCPDGVAGQCFFQKHRWKGQSKSILTFRDPQDDSGEPMLAVDGLDGLIGLVQGGVLEIHVWQSTLADLERPDQIVMDLDPGEGVAWTSMIEAAREVRARLEDAGLQSFVKTSGGKGLHVVAPLVPSAGWDNVKAFAKAVADAMADDDPDHYVATITKSKRAGKILVDYLRNGRGATAVAPYSTRARAGATISMPLAWDELDQSIGPSRFTVATMPARLASAPPDPWRDFRARATPLPVCRGAVV
jgi:bifunctional non-homologous end joining protein LigD